MSEFVYLCAAVPLLFVTLAGLALYWLRRGDENERTCAACQYVVRGISSGRCPECGADLSRPGAVLAPTHDVTRLHLWRVGIVSAMIGLMVIGGALAFRLAEQLPSKATREARLIVSPRPVTKRTRDGFRVAMFQRDEANRFPWQTREFGPADWIAFDIQSDLRAAPRWIRYDYAPQTLLTHPNQTDQIGPLTREVVAAWLRGVEPALEGATFDDMLDTFMDFAERRVPPGTEASFTADRGTVIQIMLVHTWPRSRLDSGERGSIALVVSLGWAVVCLAIGARMWIRIGRRHRTRIAERSRSSPATHGEMPATGAARLRRSPVIPIGIVMATLLAIATGAYVVGWGRSQGFGFSIANIGMDLLLLVLGSLLFVAPALILGLLAVLLIRLHVLSGAQWRWWRAAGNLVLIIVLSIAVPEAWYGAQDYMILRRNRNAPPAAKMGEGRWWPYGNHHVYYDEKLGRWMGAC